MSALSPDAFVERMREEGSRRYHDKHAFNLRMHAGELSRTDIQTWVVNR
jgi:pyrroloquinoline-quinone synthase